MSFLYAKGEGGCTGRPAMLVDELAMASMNIAPAQSRDEATAPSASGTTAQGQRLLEQSAEKLAMSGNVPAFVWIDKDGEGRLPASQKLSLESQDQQLNTVFRQLPKKVRMAGAVLAHQSDPRFPNEYELFLVCSASRYTRISSILVRDTGSGPRPAGDWREEDQLPRPLEWAQNTVDSLAS